MNNRYLIFFIFIFIFSIFFLKSNFKDNPQNNHLSKEIKIIDTHQIAFKKNTELNMIQKSKPEIELSDLNDKKIETVLNFILDFEKKYTQLKLAEINKFNSSLAIEVALLYELNLNRIQFDNITQTLFEISSRAQNKQALKIYCLVNLARLENKYSKWNNNLFQNFEQKLTRIENEKINNLISILGT